MLAIYIHKIIWFLVFNSEEFSKEGIHRCSGHGHDGTRRGGLRPTQLRAETFSSASTVFCHIIYITKLILLTPSPILNTLTATLPVEFHIIYIAGITLLTS